MSNPVKVTDVTLRDGLEDFVLKYLHQEDLTRLVSLLDRAGFYSLDCCGGATFYAALTELTEDPWERLQKIRRALTHTPLQMIIRGCMLVGFKPYQNEVVRRFMTQAAHLGVDIFRIYDNLNDLDNMAAAVSIGKELRKQVEATILFSLSPHVAIDDYLDLANGLISLGADVICLNDSFGVMTPTQVTTLISAYRRYFHQPLRLHLHDNHKTAIASYQEGIRQGAQMVDTTLASLSWAYAPPPAESLMFSLGGSSFDPHIDLDILGEVTEYVDSLKEKYQYRQPPPLKMDDHLGPAYLPGPLKEFIREELQRRDARDRQQMAFKEAQQVWGELGYPPLKGRILEIVGLQAVENLLSGGRYENLLPSMRDLLRGKYGRLHTPVHTELQWRALAEAEAPGEEGSAREGQLRSRPGLEREEPLHPRSPAPTPSPSPSPAPFSP
jgi:pyruvate carboxylase subunit B